MTLKPIVATLAFLGAVMMVAPEAWAHWSPYPHYHTYQYHYAPAPAPYRPMRPRKRRDWNELLGVGIRVSGFTAQGSKFNLESFENPIMGGIGIQFRSKFDRFWGIEFSVDYLRGKKGTVTQETIPVMLSAMFYILPGRIQPYLLAGAGAHFSKIAYSGRTSRSITEVVAQFGGGVEIRLGRSFSIFADLRGLGVWKIIGDQVNIGGTETKITDKFNLGLQFLAGGSFYF